MKRKENYNDDEEEKKKNNKYEIVQHKSRKILHFYREPRDFYNLCVFPSTGFKSSDRLSSDMETYYYNNIQSPKSLESKILFWEKLNQILKSFDSSGRSMMFGSSLNGFGTSNSDVDICIFVSRNLSSKNTLIEFKKTLLNSYKERRSKRNRESVEQLLEITFINATIPLLKLKEKNFENSYILEIDICCNNENGIRNTHLLYAYSRLEPRVSPFILVLKRWASAFDIHDSKAQTLSSYSLSLLGLHFLQIISPPVIPCLQRELPEYFSVNSSLFSLPFFSESNAYPTATTSFLETTFSSKNTSSLGQLFKDCMNYYGFHFDFANDVVSVRTGSVLSADDCVNYVKNVGLSIRQWTAYILIEDPFERNNVARCIFTREKFDKIHSAFKKTNEALCSNAPISFLSS